MAHALRTPQGCNPLKGSSNSRKDAAEPGSAATELASLRTASLAGPGAASESRQAPLARWTLSSPSAIVLPVTTEPTSLDASDDFDVRRIIIRLVIAMVVLVAAAMTAMIVFRDELTAISKVFVDALGGPGISLGYMLPDAFTVPLPNDAFTFFGYIGGIPFWECVMWGSIGSLVGGSLGWCIGRLLQRTQGYQRVMATRGKEIQQLFDRYATPTVLVAALTPLPYSLACWAAGAGGMRYSWFIFISLSRIIKVALYLYLIELGIVQIT